MIDFSKLQFLPIDMPNPPDVEDVLDTISFEEMNTDEYRNCFHIPLMDGEGEWLPVASKVPELVDWAEKHLFTWAGRGRIMIITTLPGKHNPPHIDCSPERFETWQHKFRVVLRGNVDDLSFISRSGTTSVPNINKPYMMSGKWPHEMHNTYNGIKYTFALGAPWEPEANDKSYIDMLERSYNKYKDYYMSFDNLELPENVNDLYEKKYYV